MMQFIRIICAAVLSAAALLFFTSLFLLFPYIAIVLLRMAGG